MGISEGGVGSSQRYRLICFNTRQIPLWVGKNELMLIFMLISRLFLLVFGVCKVKVSMSTMSKTITEYFPHGQPKLALMRRF